MMHNAIPWNHFNTHQSQVIEKWLVQKRAKYQGNLNLTLTFCYFLKLSLLDETSHETKLL